MTASGLLSEGGELNSPKVLEELFFLPPAAVGEEAPLQRAGEGQSSQGMLAATQPCSFTPGEDVVLGCHHLLQHCQSPGNCFAV